MGKVNRQYVDRANRKPTVSFRTSDLSGDITADMVAINAFLVALEAITLLNPVKTDIVASTTRHAGALPTATGALKEISWLIHYRDTVTGQNYVYSVPGADHSLLADGTDRMDITAGFGQAFVGNFEAVVVSPDNNPVEVVYIEIKN